MTEKFIKEIEEFSTAFGALPEFPSPYGKPSALPNKPHPRVWVNSETVVAARRNMNHPENKFCLEKIIEKAEREGDGTLPPRGEARYNFTLESISDIECIAYLYLMTGKEEYGYRAVRNALNWLASIDFDKPRNSTEHYNMANVASYSILVMGEVYDWCYDLLSDKTKRQIAVGTVNRLGPRLEVGYPPNGLGVITGHGTSAQILRDWLCFSIATYDEFPEFYNCVVGRILNEYIEAPNFYYPSGANFQGTSYGINKTYLHMISEMIMQTATDKKIYAPDVSFEATCATYMHYIRPDGEALRIGDVYDQRPKNYNTYDLARLAFFGGSYYKNKALKGWSNYLTDGFKRIGWYGRCEFNPMIFILLNDPDVPSEPKNRFSLPLVNYCGSPMGKMIARSAWGDDGAWMTYSKVGEIYGANHDHKDAGSFQIYYKGILALTSSCYEFCGRENYGSLLDVGYNKQSISKNCILIYNPEFPEPDDDNVWDKKWINSGGQRFRGSANGENSTLKEWLSKPSSHQAKIIAHGFEYDRENGVKYAYLAGDITNAYDEITVKQVIRHTISVSTGIKTHPLIFAVYDTVASQKSHFKKKFVLHTTDEPKIKENVFSFTNTDGKHIVKSTVERKYNGKLTDTVLLPKDAVIDVIGGDGKRFFVNGTNLAEELLESDPEGRQEIGWGRVEITSASDKLSDTFFNVMYVSDADNDDADVPVYPIESDTHDGALSMGKAILFGKNGVCEEKSVSFSTSFDGMLDYYVADIASGEWQVCVNGKAVGNFKSTDEEKMLRFTASAGKVDILRIK